MSFARRIKRVSPPDLSAPLAPDATSLRPPSNGTASEARAFQGHIRDLAGSSFDAASSFEIIDARRVSLRSCLPQRSASVKILRDAANGPAPRKRRVSQPSAYRSSPFQIEEGQEVLLPTIEARSQALNIPLKSTLAVDSERLWQSPYGLITPPTSESNLSSLSTSPDRPPRSPLRRLSATPSPSPLPQSTQLAPQPASSTRRRLSVIPSSGARIFDESSLSPSAKPNRHKSGFWDSVVDPLCEGAKIRPDEGYPRIDRSAFIAPRPPSERFESGPLLASRDRSHSVGRRVSLPARAKVTAVDESAMETLAIPAVESQTRSEDSHDSPQKSVKHRPKSTVAMTLVRPGTFDDGVRWGFLRADRRAQFTGGAALFFPRVVQLSLEDSLTSRFVIEARSWSALLKVVGSYAGTLFAASNEGDDFPEFQEAALTLEFLLSPIGDPIIRLGIFLPRNLLSLSHDLSYHSNPNPTFSLSTHPILPFSLGSLAGPLGTMRALADITGSSSPALQTSLSYDAMRAFDAQIKKTERPPVKAEEKVGKLRRLMRSKSLKVIRR